MQELDIPTHATCTFNPESLLNFRLKVDLSTETCLWQGGKYEFTIDISPNYPHEAPKCHC